MSPFNEIVKIADIHASRIEHAIEKLKTLFPLSSKTVSNLSEENFLYIELLVNRFAKLQDFIGAKLIDAFFESTGESTENLTMIDKINKLEKLELIANSDVWMNMREVRNHLAHEYPDHPEITAKYLNKLLLLSPQLLLLLNNLKQANKG